MLENLFKGIFDAEWMSAIKVSDFIICMVAALVLGAVIAISCMYKSYYSQSYALTVALLPAVVCVVIMLVNGNIGAGVAVAGAFSLVRFRSAAGSAREICTLFFSMGVGLICGMGYIGIAIVFTVIICAIFVLYNVFGFGLNKKASLLKTIRIVIPEDLDYTGIFDDIFDEYLSFVELESVKTTNMGSLFKLTYDIRLKDASKEKEMIDKIRCRNGNLEISISRKAAASTDL